MQASSGTQVNRSIVDGISVIQALAVSNRPIGGRELARMLRLEPTRVNRLLKTLAYLGITQQDSRRKYLPGPGMHVLATQSLYASGLLRCAIGPLEKLSYLNHTVALGVLWRDSVSFLYHARPGMSSNEAIGRIGLRPATGSGIGMVLLACASEEQVIETYRGEEILGYPAGIDALLAELSKIGEQGYARILVQSTLPENPRGSTHTVAVPVGSPATCAIAVSGSISASECRPIVASLREARDEIMRAMEQIPSYAVT